MEMDIIHQFLIFPDTLDITAVAKVIFLCSIVNLHCSSLMAQQCNMETAMYSVFKVKVL